MEIIQRISRSARLLPYVAGVISFAGSAAADTTDSASAYQLNVVYTNETWDNTSGGIKHGVMSMNNLDAALSVDAGEAFGWTGGTLHLEAFYENSQSLEDQYVGAIDTQSSIDTTGPSMFRIYQVYYDQAWSSTDVRFGIYDLETEFSNTKPELLFLSKNYTWNTAFDLSGTMTANGVIGPGNYPYTPLALRVRQQLADGLSVMVAVSDGAADSPNHPEVNAVDFNSKYGALGIAELDYEPARHVKWMAGAWGLTSELPVYNGASGLGQPSDTRGDAGAYVGGAFRLYQPDDSKGGLDTFFTAGLADPTVSEVNQSFNAGFTYTGPFADRPNDKVGIALAENHSPEGFQHFLKASGQPPVSSTETSFELTYRTHLFGDWVTLQPDVQYIMNPGYVYKNDMVFGLHIEIGHVFEL